jgi:hypothetical protein
MGEQAIPDLIPWDKISGPFAAAEDALARLAERLRACRKFFSRLRNCQAEG